MPNVDSVLVGFRRGELPGTDAERRETFALVDAAFGQRRKMLRAALAPLFGSAAAASAAIERAGQDPQARGETLDVAAFCAVAAQLSPIP